MDAPGSTSVDRFPAICAVTLLYEGGLSMGSMDPGNWTGGAVGSGLLRGTRFGISAAAFPTLDIQALSQGQAVAIYRALYWNKVFGDLLCEAGAAPLALLAFDAAVNTGTGRAARWLQSAVGAEVDGAIGPSTLAAVGRAAATPAGLLDACAAFQTSRMIFMTGLSTWSSFSRGWSRRLCHLPFQAAAFIPASNPA